MGAGGGFSPYYDSKSNYHEDYALCFNFKLGYAFNESLILSLDNYSSILRNKDLDSWAWENGSGSFTLTYYLKPVTNSLYGQFGLLGLNQKGDYSKRILVGAGYEFMKHFDISVAYRRTIKNNDMSELRVVVSALAY